MTALLIALIVAYGLDTRQHLKQVASYQQSKHWDPSYLHTEEGRLFTERSEKIINEALQKTSSEESAYDVLMQVFEKYKIDKKDFDNTTLLLSHKEMCNEEYEKFCKDYETAVSQAVIHGDKVFIRRNILKAGHIKIFCPRENSLELQKLEQEVYDFENGNVETAGVELPLLLMRQVFKIKDGKEKNYHAVLMCPSLFFVYATLLRGLIDKLIDDTHYFERIEGTYPVPIKQQIKIRCSGKTRWEKILNTTFTITLYLTILSFFAFIAAVLLMLFVCMTTYDYDYSTALFGGVIWWTFHICVSAVLFGVLLTFFKSGDSSQKNNKNPK